MSSTTISTLMYISQEITIYAGFIILITGIIGGLLNIIIFLSLRTFREAPCTFYLIVMSIVNIANLLTGLLSRILISGFDLDWTLISSWYCKMRWYGLQLGVLTSFTCTCFTAIDQYMSTNARLQWRYWSNIKTARRLTAICILVWLVHGIFYLIYFNLVQSPTTGAVVCMSTNVVFQRYHVYGYLIVLAGIIPLVITTIFGLLAFHNVHLLAYRTVPIVQRSLDKQLTRMVLNQLLYNFIFTFPYTFLTTLTSFLTNIKDPTIVEKFNFANVMVILLYYMSFSVSLKFLFYIKRVFLIYFFFFA